MHELAERRAALRLPPDFRHTLCGVCAHGRRFGLVVSIITLTSFTIFASWLVAATCSGHCSHRALPALAMEGNWSEPGQDLHNDEHVLQLVKANHEAELQRLRKQLEEADRANDRMDAARRRAEAEAVRLRAEAECRDAASRQRIAELERGLADARAAATAGISPVLGVPPCGRSPARASQSELGNHERSAGERAALVAELERADLARENGISELRLAAEAARRTNEALSAATEARLVAEAAREQAERERAEALAACSSAVAAHEQTSRAAREGTLVVERIDLSAHSHIPWRDALATACAAMRELHVCSTPAAEDGCALRPEESALGRARQRLVAPGPMALADGKPSSAGAAGDGGDHRGSESTSECSAPMAAASIGDGAVSALEVSHAASRAERGPAAPPEGVGFVSVRWVCGECAFVNAPPDADGQVSSVQAPPVQCEVCAAARPDPAMQQHVPASAGRPSLALALVSKALNATGLSTASERARAAGGGGAKERRRSSQPPPADQALRS